ncbi:MAG TPA: peroxidase-related enzyme [Candidatus Dietzia intestinipullorum]|nr:peroxidase-related enzyme [Candidatus Dietzia intestinipullorum]
MSDRYPVAELTDLPEDLRERILAEQEKAGFVPAVFLMFGRRPAESRAFFVYHDALMDREGSNLSKAEKEMIVVTVSGQNNCLFCVVAHGAILRVVKKDPYIADQLAVSHHTAPLTPRERAICDFATAVNLRSDELDDDDFAALHEHGLDDEDAWDIASIAALFGLSNRVANATGMRPNPEFYLMGRTPRQK